MFEAYNVTNTSYTTNAPLNFNTIKFTDTTISSSGGTTFNITRPGYYCVEYIAVEGSSTAAAPITLQLYNNGTAVPETYSEEISTLANDLHTLGAHTVIRVLPSCAAVNSCASLQVLMTATNPAVVHNATLIIKKLR